MKKYLFVLIVPFLFSFIDWDPRPDQYGSEDDYFRGHVIVADSFLVVLGDTIYPGEYLQFKDTAWLVVTPHFLDSLLTAREFLTRDEMNDVRDSVSDHETRIVQLEDLPEDEDIDPNNEKITDVDYSDNTLTIIESGKPWSVNIIGGGETSISNARSGDVTVNSSHVEVTFSSAFPDNNYFYLIEASYDKTINGATKTISNGLSNFVPTSTGFSLDVRNPAGKLRYFCVDDAVFMLQDFRLLADTLLASGTPTNRALIDSLRNRWSKQEITDEDIERWNTPGNYQLPVATTDILGGIKVDGTTVAVNQDGVLSSLPGEYNLPTASTSVKGGVKVDGTTIVINDGVISAPGETSPGVITLSGTAPTWNAQDGLVANLSISGNTVITLSNLQPGSCGTIFLDNPSTSYQVAFSGYTFDVNPNLNPASDAITLSGNYEHDILSWVYNGNVVAINGSFSYE